MSQSIFIFFVYFILRVPLEGDIRVKWINAISKYQTFEYNRHRFNVCKRHFNDSDFSNETTALILGAVPSIFEKPIIVVDAPHFDALDIATNNSNNQCFKCSSHEKNIDDLKSQLFTLKVQHEVERQKLKHKIYLLENQKDQKIDQVKQYREELSREKKANFRLKDVVAELKNRNLISEDSEKILNVRLFFDIFPLSSKTSLR